MASRRKQGKGSGAKKTKDLDPKARGKNVKGGVKADLKGPNVNLKTDALNDFTRDTIRGATRATRD